MEKNQHYKESRPQMFEKIWQTKLQLPLITGHICSHGNALLAHVRMAAKVLLRRGIPRCLSMENSVSSSSGFAMGVLFVMYHIYR